MIDSGNSTPRACIALVDVAMFVNAKGEVGLKIEEWAQSPETMRQLINALADVQRHLLAKVEKLSGLVLPPGVN